MLKQKDNHANSTSRLNHLLLRATHHLDLCWMGFERFLWNYYGLNQFVEGCLDLLCEGFCHLFCFLKKLNLYYCFEAQRMFGYHFQKKYCCLFDLYKLNQFYYLKLQRMRNYHLNPQKEEKFQHNSNESLDQIYAY